MHCLGIGKGESIDDFDFICGNCRGASQVVSSSSRSKFKDGLDHKNVVTKRVYDDSGDKRKQRSKKTPTKTMFDDCDTDGELDLLYIPFGTGEKLSVSTTSSKSSSASRGSRKKSRTAVSGSNTKRQKREKEVDEFEFEGLKSNGEVTFDTDTTTITVNKIEYEEMSQSLNETKASLKSIQKQENDLNKDYNHIRKLEDINTKYQLKIPN